MILQSLIRKNTISHFMTTKVGLWVIFIFLFLAGCDKSPDGIIDSSGRRPNLVAVVLTTPSFNTDTILVHGQKTPSDELTLPVGFNATIGIPVTTVWAFHYVVTRTSNGVEVTSGYIVLTKTEQLQIEEIKNSITLHKSFSLTLQRTDVGTFSVEISAIDVSGLESNAFQSPMSILRLNRLPQISDLQAPDTLQLPATGSVVILLALRIYDPDGETDIQKVQFTSVLPNGKPSSSGPIQMYDDGGMVDLGGYTSGDAIAADDIYSRMIQLRSDAARGTYTFSFVAIDKSSDSSNVITHIITVQ